MSTTELSDVISSYDLELTAAEALSNAEGYSDDYSSVQPFESYTRWETLRAALESYAKYAWEEDVLEITEDCVTIADDMCEEKGMHDMLEAMLDAVELNLLQHKQPPPSGNLTEDEWDKIGRQMLENLVLAEFARKIAAQYVL